MKRLPLKTPLARIAFRTLAGTACVLSLTTVFPAGDAMAAGRAPALTITNEPLPADLQNKVYSKPARTPDISSDQVLGTTTGGGASETLVGKKATELRNELFALQGKVATLSEKLAGYESRGRMQAAEYYASVATISTQLQSGTTPGNPRLVQRLDTARGNLEKLSENISGLNDLAVEITDAASLSAYLLDSARAAYSLSGALEEDHVRLAQLEDSVNGTVVIIDRLLTNANDDITRTVAYLNTERENLRTLALAINAGDLFGRSLSNRSFAPAQPTNVSPEGIPAAYTATPSAPSTVPGGARPLVKIRFDKADVAFEQPVYMAVNEALNRYPEARFEIVAVNPATSNAAAQAIESTRARRNAERVLRSLTQMGLPADRIDLSYMTSSDTATSEVHLYVR